MRDVTWAGITQKKKPCTPEDIVFGEFANAAEKERKVEFTSSLDLHRKQAIEKYVREKLASKNNLGNQLRGSPQHGE